MSDFIDGLERDLVEAARRRAAAGAAGRGTTRVPRRRPPLRTLLVAAAILVPTAGTAAAGTLLALRGSAIPAPDAVPPEQTPVPNTSRVSELRAADPAAGIPPWTVRVARSETGLLCSTVGQVVDGQFGLVGLDGRFRTIADGVSDSCGSERRGAASLVGARVFDAKQRADVRTVVSGFGGSDLRRVDVETLGRSVRAPVRDGVFATVLRGYPEDNAIRATLTFASGRHEVHDFGRSAFVVPDPLGGPAWRTTAYMVSGDRRSCTAFRWARQVAGGPQSPTGCGDLGEGRHRRGWYFAVRKIRPGTGGRPFELQGEGNWGRHPARTAVWGGAGEDVAAVSVQVGTGRPRRLTIPPSRVFLSVLDPKVDLASITVRLRLKSGRTVVAHGSTGLVHHKLASRDRPRPVPPAGRKP
ncbi:MAG TPA: hypothetical protein VK501_07760 [Baekduia sp.]|uniref:hypothetical protein n=1 Tax=Baekduia sp. TaxID=2600305 RepID=UPI002C3F0AC7|nr:hypothetical protein [Baekduia sp.]HMJ33797.1 hypothetical protein [Baekduia sp.]